MITSLLRQNDIATTFWINYDVIITSCVRWEDLCSTIPDSKVHGANMEPNWVLSASNGPHVGSMNLAIRVFETIYDHIHCDDNKSDFLLSTVLANILASFETKCQDICGYGLFMDHAVKIKLCKNANTWLLCTRQLAHCAVGGCISLETWGQYQYPADTLRDNNVIMTSKRRCDVVLTS